MTAVSLLETFGFSSDAMVAAVGGGGKTSLVFRIATEATEAGIPSVVTTTVKFTRPPGMPMPPVVRAQPETAQEAAAAALARAPAVTLSSGEGERGRMLGYRPEVVDGLRAPGRLVLVEADGSAQRPFKAPASHEPVIPGSATDVVVCVGVQVLGRPLDPRWVHRPELVGELCGLAPGEAITPAAVAAVVLHPRGGRKGVPEGARLHVLLSLPAPGEPSSLARELAERLGQRGGWRVVLAAPREGFVYGALGDAMVSAPASNHG